MDDQTSREKRPLTDWIPSKWSNHIIWLTAYRVHGLRQPPAALATSHLMIDLDGLQVRVVIHFCDFHFQARRLNFRFRPFGKGIQANDSEFVKPMISTGLHIFFIAPSLGDSEPRDPRHQLGNIGTAVSLVAALCGRNAVFEHICDQDITPNSKGHIGFSGPMEVPWSLGEPDLTPERLALINGADHKMQGLQVSEKKRVVLSLRWYRMGFGDLGVDAFLKYWIAIETLAANAKSINQMLSKGYSIPIQRTGEKFLIGRLQSLRGDIVHKGRIPANIDVLKRYLEAVYTDLLCEFLSLPFLSKAEASMDVLRPKILQLLEMGHAGQTI